jgi:DNA-binding NarL/FixJ family response regulator
MTSSVKVLIADDHAVVRAGLSHILSAEQEIQIVAEAANGQETIDLALKYLPHVILLDIYMPECTGLDAMLAIREKAKNIKFLILTVSENEDDLFQAIKYGANGYLLKSASIDEVAQAVIKTAKGEAILSSRIAARLMDEFREKSHSGVSLSEREQEVLQFVGEGLTNLEIAERLFIGESTVRTHLQRLIEKLHLKNRAEAIAYASRRSLKK